MYQISIGILSLRAHPKSRPYQYGDYSDFPGSDWNKHCRQIKDGYASAWQQSTLTLQVCVVAFLSR